MRRIIFFMVPLYGHVYPNYSLLKQLSESNFEVICYCAKKFDPFFKALNVTLKIYCDELIQTFSNSRNQDIQVEKYAVSYYSSQIDGLGMNAAADLELLRAKLVFTYYLDEIKEFNPDCILYDSTATWAVVIAKKLGIPCYSIELGTFLPQMEGNATYDRYCTEVISKELDISFDIDLIHVQTDRMQRRIIRELAAIANVNPKGLNGKEVSFGYLSDKLQIQSEYLSDRQIMVGFNIDVPYAIKKEEQVFISRGTIFDDYNLHILTLILRAMGNAKYKVIATLGNMIECEKVLYDDIREMSNINLYNEVNQVEELCRSKVMISHGGVTGVREAIFCETPIVIFPSNFHCFQVGLAVEKAGAGIMLNEHPFSKDELLKAVDKIYNNDKYMEGVKELKESLIKEHKENKILNFIEKRL